MFRTKIALVELLCCMLLTHRAWATEPTGSDRPGLIRTTGEQAVETAEPGPATDPDEQAEPAPPAERLDPAPALDPPRPPLSPRMLQLQDRMHRCLEYYATHRLNTRDDSPWSIMHALIGFGIHTQVHVGGPRGRQVNAIAWLCGNGTCDGVKMLSIRNGQLAVALGPGLQGHEGQFLAMLAQSRVKIDYPIIVNRKRLSVADLVRTEQRSCRPNSELTFKLIGLSHYLDSDATWKDAHNRQWSIQRLIQSELAQPINGVTCGGTHRLMGFSYSLRKRMQSGRPVVGQWRRARKYVQDYHRYTFRLQNRDGSFSTSFFRGRENRPDIDRRLETTGHILEWLVYSLPEQELGNLRMVRAVEYLANLMLQYRNHPWPVGPRGHAIRALVLYQQRVFGADPGQPPLQVATKKAKTGSR